MAFSALHCAVLSIGASAFLLSRKPERASLFSYSGVALALFLLSIALKIFYTVVVYPIFFTPFKHIPVPPVRNPFLFAFPSSLSIGLTNYREEVL